MLLAHLFLTFRIVLTSLGLVSTLEVAFAFAFGFSWGHGLRNQKSKKNCPTPWEGIGQVITRLSVVPAADLQTKSSSGPRWHLAR
jgi:hypothetical protein